ncbi:MAG: conjugal transfer protein TraD, partial [Erythrobacteraceae bacterium]
MTAGNDFITRAHALWRVRMAQLQQRFGVFARLVLLSGGAGAIIAPQFVMSAPELKVAAQCLGAKALVILGEMAGKELMMNVALEGRRWTVPASFVASDPLIAGTLSKALVVLNIGAVLGCALG